MALLSLAPGAAAQVALRGGDTINDPVVSVTIEGVQIGGASPRLIGWDRVRQVEGEHADAAQAFAELSDVAWRARTRLERGDVTLAQPLFEELFETYDGVDGPTALIVAQGLLQCRLATLAQPAAVAP